MLFNKLKILCFLAAGLFLAVDGRSAAQEDMYTLTLKGYKTPKTTAQLQQEAGSRGTSFTGGRFDFKPESADLYFPARPHIVGGEYHLTIPKSWVQRAICSARVFLLFSMKREKGLCCKNS